MMSVGGFDFAHLNRRRWVRCYGAGCRADRAQRRRDCIGAVVLFVLGVLLGGLSAQVIGCESAGFSVHAGIGAHAKGLSAPDYVTPNPIGLIEARYTRGRYEWSLSHRSSLQGFPAVFDSPDEGGYGVNMVEFRVRLW